MSRRKTTSKANERMKIFILIDVIVILIGIYMLLSSIIFLIPYAYIAIFTLSITYLILRGIIGFILIVIGVRFYKLHKNKM